MDATAARSARLSRFFNSCVLGKRSIQKTEEAKLLLEAICDQQDRRNCIERIVASPHALEALRNGLRTDTTTIFIKSNVSPFLLYLNHPQVKQLCNGQLLQQLLSIVVDPPTFWNALILALPAHSLDSDLGHAAAWLIAELLQQRDYQPVNLVDTAEQLTHQRTFLDSTSHDVRALGSRILHILQTRSAVKSSDPALCAGGRHDNDFEDFHRIAIYPTTDELLSKQRPFYRPGDAVNNVQLEERFAMHLDNQFRLLREDMLGELRSDLQTAKGQKRGRRQAVVLQNLSLFGADMGEIRKRKPCGLTFRGVTGIAPLSAMQPAERKSYLAKNKNFLRHQSFGCLLSGENIVAFAFVDRNEDLLCKEEPTLSFQLSDEESLQRVLLHTKLAERLDFISVDTPVFAYEPILRCLQKKHYLPLAEKLLMHPDPAIENSDLRLNSITDGIEQKVGEDLKDLLRTPNSVRLDASQTQSLLAGLKQELSLVQGPPGTGKSFIGALLAKILYDHTIENILVMTYTNHALDQFLEDLMDVGIPVSAMVRLGSKSTPKTQPLSLYAQAGTYRPSKSTWDIVEQQNSKLVEYEHSVKTAVATYAALNLKANDVLDYLEFSDDDFDFFQGLSTPAEDDGMTMVGKGGKVIGADYLFNRWSNNLDAGQFRDTVGSEYNSVWGLEWNARRGLLDKWKRQCLQEQVNAIQDLIKAANRSQTLLSEALNERRSGIIRGKRIIGCTTTAAAMYTQQLQSAAPGIIMVEEAGEILESHIWTAMSANTKQLILIGDHQQLRPKINNYALTVEKGDGYDLNCSMFERLVKAGYPHTTLAKQHRMCPEVSSLVRLLTYPDLLDAESTENRPPLRGLQDRVIFFNHHHPEVNAAEIADRRDEGSKASKRNIFEVELVLKIVRYLGQQGYGTDRLVVLTPYLGQLHLLREQLSKEVDPILNDLDSFDLVRAGLIDPISAQLKKRPIKISTIDNYQGEESDIVIATLTRSNEAGDIGFMAAPERLNVLLSRARDGLITIGNADTFLQSRKGKKVWKPFMDYLSEKGHIYDGLPVKCEQHPDRKAILRRKEDFDMECPDGGCAEPCGTKLNCGLHDCPQRCHQLFDHSKIKCEHTIKGQCPIKHELHWRCHQGKPATCKRCDDEVRRQQRRIERDNKLEAQREARQREYARQLADLQDEIAHQRRLTKESRERDDMDQTIQQTKQELEDAKVAARRAREQPPTRAVPAKSPSTSQQNKPNSLPVRSKEKASGLEQDPGRNRSNLVPSAYDEWEFDKTSKGEHNEALDSLMGMIGLEDVKLKFLTVKAKVDAVARQGTDMKRERFGAAFLGNPGTGKTTVARLYAKFLSSVGALPGGFFVETTGSRLANDGINGCKKHIEEILNNGGGCFFIDEAYQLTSGNSYGGATVLDFLLAEVENLTGKVVFILAGYNKQMESFFAHNPGLPSRFPNELQFKDYDDDELLDILAHNVQKKWNGNMDVEDGIHGLYMRIVSRRIGRGRGKEGFGNARATENAVQNIANRQAIRLRLERRAGKSPSDFLLTKEDLIGPEPSGILKDNRAWLQLQSLTGLTAVKQALQALLDTIKTNYLRELEEEPLMEFNLNRVFLGNPGTGKTTVAKLYGQILADIGFLSNGEVVVKNPADFVGSALGQSEKTTKGILASSMGKVLVIDEAYGLYGANGSTSGAQADPYKTAVIDTIVAEVQGTPGEDRCVLLLGYKEQMEMMFQNVNPGLTRRFALDSAFVFEDYTDDELQQILELKLKRQGFAVTDQSKRVAMDVLKRARNRPHFGNGGEVDNLLNVAKGRHQQRVTKGATKNVGILEALDFDEDFDRGERAATNIRKLFEGTVGSEQIVEKLQGYQQIVANMTAKGWDPREQIPFTFLFRGPPGTGKTTTARKIAKVYYDMGFLANASTVDCSATDLMGEYVGQTGPKVQKLFEKALGKVLFVDEAYRLADGAYAKEAMDEIVDTLTKPQFAQKLIVILAGYDNDINRLMSTNPGLTSRFPETIVFNNMKLEDCFKLLKQALKKKNLDISELEAQRKDDEIPFLERFETLSALANWGNARDVLQLSKNIFGHIIRSSNPGDELSVKPGMVIAEMEAMITEREHRANSATLQQPRLPLQELQQAFAPNHHAPPPTFQTSHSTQLEHTVQLEKEKVPVPPVEMLIQSPTTADGHPRDAGVSDAVWQQLQHDKHEAEQREEQYQRLIEEEERAQAELRALEAAAKQAIDNAARDEAKRRHEEARLRSELKRRALEAVERKRKEELQAQAKLRRMGVCVAGYQWIKQHNGYRCAGGSHFVSDTQLDAT